MDAWLKFYQDVEAEVTALDSDMIFFRGQGSSEWPLLSSFGRIPEAAVQRFYEPDVRFLEADLYYDFLTRGGDLIPRSNDSWDNLFLMQHHGVPTRLLDWTESFAIALYFALRDAKDQPTVWLLDPFALNEPVFKSDIVPDTENLHASYDEYFLKGTTTFPGSVIALRPRRHMRRLAQQSSVFTFHADSKTPLETLCPDALKKFALPPRALTGARRFLRLANIREYTLFPDLDGLARDIKRQYVQSA